MRVNDPFEHDDAAFVLGALPAAERAAYERHLAGCAACRTQVDSLRGIADGLGRLEVQDVLDVQGVDVQGVAAQGVDAQGVDAQGVDAQGVDAQRSDVPPQELAQLLDAVGCQRQRRVWAVRALGGLAAAAIAALIVVISSPGSSPAPGQSPPAAQAMSALVPSPVTAQVSLRQAGWGTEVQVQCRYRAVSGYPGAGVYDLVVVDRGGVRYPLGSWTLSAGNRASFSSPVALPTAAIRSVQVTTADGTPILQLGP